MRPRDLVAIWASWRDLTLERGSRTASLIAGSKGGLLRFRFDYQHLAEQSYFDKPENFPIANPGQGRVPVNARAAGRSRLVFKVPAGQAIGFSIEGLLEAMGELELVVAPAAAPAGIGLGQLFGTVAENGAMVTQARRLLVDSDGEPITRLEPVVARDLEGRRAMTAANRMRRGGILDGIDAAFVPDQIVRPKWTVPAIRDPAQDETAIEAPFRLVISPSVKGGWAHATQPVPDSRASRVELWHTRLGVRGRGGVNEAPAAERIVRAVWARDRENLPKLPFDADNSLSGDHRRSIVNQSAGMPEAPNIRPRPIDVRRLALSSLGAWLDVDARWNAKAYVKAYTGLGYVPLEAWEHVAPMGRDQWVRVVTPGYLFPLGHAASLVTITYRQIVGTTKPQAFLFKKQYITVAEPQKTFNRRDLPFVSARLSPGRTPDLNQETGNIHFWPTPFGKTKKDAFEWKIEALDHDGQSVHLQAPLLFVPLNGKLDSDDTARRVIQKEYADRYKTIDDGIPAHGQLVAFAPALEVDEGPAAAGTSSEVDRLLLGGEPRSTSSAPFLQTARVVVPAMQRLTGAADPVQVAYPKVYKTGGFNSGNAGNVFLELADYVGFDKPPAPDVAALSFGTSERSGGFIQPDVRVAGLARSTGLVPNVDDAALGTFKAGDLFGAGLPRLFGLFKLTDLIPDGVLDLAPKFVTEALDRVSGLLADLAALKAAIDEFALPAPQFDALAKEVNDAIAQLLAGDAEAIGPARIQTALDDLRTELDTIAGEVGKLPFQPMALATFDRLLDGLRAALASDMVDTVLAFADGLLPGGGEFRAKLDWRPLVRNVKIGDAEVLKFDKHDKALVVSVEARTAGAKPSGFEVAAQLSDFQLILLPHAPLMEVHFERIAFRASGARRPEIDIVFKELQFVGVLSFVQVLKELIPLDGFSDPPFLDVSAEGISAGFTVALPNLAIGVFSLTNLALGADARVPFLGEKVSVGFNFCTRERPFTLAVAFLGGGGFLGLRLNPDGMVLLEGAFEFGAVVALDFGVASGSVSVMAGIYFKIEGDQGQLTGYVRIRGEVDVLGLISASLELYLALTYYTAPQDKLIGEATMTIKVEVLFFSTSVSVKARRVFAGSNGDPTVRQMLLFEERGDAIWNEYWAAFAPAKAKG